MGNNSTPKRKHLTDKKLTVQMVPQGARGVNAKGCCGSNTHRVRVMRVLSSGRRVMRDS